MSDFFVGVLAGQALYWAVALPVVLLTGWHGTAASVAYAAYGLACGVVSMIWAMR